MQRQIAITSNTQATALNTANNTSNAIATPLNCVSTFVALDGLKALKGNTHWTGRDTFANWMAKGTDGTSRLTELEGKCVASVYSSNQFARVRLLNSNATQLRFECMLGFPEPTPIPAPSVAQQIAAMHQRIGCFSYSTEEEEEEETTKEEEEEFECANCCATTTDATDMQTIDSELYCNDCCMYCENCSDYVVSQDGDIWDETRECSVCEDCVSRYYSNCEDCGTTTNDIDITDGFCPKCLENKVECYSCGHLFDQDSIVSRHDEYYCEECAPLTCDGDCTQCNTAITLQGIEEETRQELRLSDTPVVSEEGFQKVINLISAAKLNYWHPDVTQMSRATVNQDGKFATRLGAILQSLNKDDLGQSLGNVRNTMVEVLRTKAQKDAEGNVIRNTFNQIVYVSEYVQTNLLSEVGNIVSQYTLKSDTIWFSFTRDLNKRAGYYCNSGSCWFGSDSYSQSRCILKHSGGFAFLLHDGDTSNTTGRIWIQPAIASVSSYNGKPQLEVTTDEESANCWIAFNGYSDNASNAQNMMAQTFATFMQLETAKFGLSVPEMYVNSDKCHLIASQDVLDMFSDKTTLYPSGWEDCGNWCG